jgi:hypothetical protein
MLKDLLGFLPARPKIRASIQSSVAVEDKRPISANANNKRGSPAAAPALKKQKLSKADVVDLT